MEVSKENKFDGNQSSPRSIFPGYALYKFHANRPKSAASIDTEKKEEASVAEFLSREAKADDNFSLNVVLTSLNAENEMELRKFLAKRLSKGTTYAGSGQISGLDLSVESEDPNAGGALCFYTLLRQESDSQDTGAADVIPDANNIYTSNEFLLCLMASHEVSLDLFRPEMNQFSQKVLDMLESDPILKYELEGCEEFSSLEAQVWPCLEHWYDHVSEYLTRCVQALQESLRYVVYAALMGSELNVRCKDPELKEDIMRFMSVCSLSELVDSMPGEDLEVKAGHEEVPLVTLSDTCIATDTQSTITITQQEDGAWLASPDGCSDFCDVWASTLVSSDDNNPELLRQLIDNFKLKAIQDMNTLKRHLRQAESDYYALYRCHVFLKTCGNSQVLLKHVATEAGSCSNSRDVLKVLQDLMLVKRSASAS